MLGMYVLIDHFLHQAFDVEMQSFFDLFTRAGEPGKEKLIIMMQMQEYLRNIALHERTGANQDVRSRFVWRHSGLMVSVDRAE